MKAFVLMEKGYEYDDNYYNPTDGGSPQKIFFDYDQALIEKIKLDIKKFKAHSFESYVYYEDIEYVIEDMNKFKKFNEKLKEKYGEPAYTNPWNRLEEYQLHPSANEEESNEFVRMVDFSYYEVQEVDVDKNSFRNHQIESVLD